MTIKSTKLAVIVTAALSLAVPLALSATPADAASMYGSRVQYGYQDNRGAMPISNHIDDRNIQISFHDNYGGGFNDRNHRPAPRGEMRMPMPHRGYHWHAGNWNFQRGHWVWVGGFWNVR